MNDTFMMGAEAEVTYRQQQVRADYHHSENVLMHWLRSHRPGHSSRRPDTSSTGRGG